MHIPTVNVHLRYHRTEHYGKRFRVTIEICGGACMYVCLVRGAWDGCCEKEKKKYENIFIKAIHADTMIYAGDSWIPSMFLQLIFFNAVSKHHFAYFLCVYASSSPIYTIRTLAQYQIKRRRL